MRHPAWTRPFISLLFTVLGVALPLHAGAGPLFPNPVYTVGTNPYGMVIADFNRDGIEDIIVSDFGAGYDGGPGDLSLLFGRGDGTFATEIRIPTQQHPVDVAVADVDRDGIADLILTYTDNTAVLMLGRPNATFGSETVVADRVASLHLANFNNDGIPDLLIEGASVDSYFQALLGQGNGTFAAAAIVSAGPSFSPIPADVNGDGRDDVLTLSLVPLGYTPNLIQVYLGAGDGTFAPAGSFATGEYAYFLLPVDLDGDGHLDLGVDTIHQHPDGYGVTGPFILYFGNGDGTFNRGPSEDGVSAAALVASDLNGDGFQDYVRIGDFGVNPFLGNGDRTYSALPFFYTGFGVTRARGGDFDRDGRIDLAILANFSEAVFTYGGNGDGTFGPPLIQTIRDSFLGGLVTDDFNGDGALDIAAALLEDDQVAILPGIGNGNFGAGIRSPAGVGPLFLASADLNGDGRRDLVVGTRNWHSTYPEVLPPGGVLMLLGNGDGTFQAPVSYACGLLPNAMHVQDLDGDGHVDVLIANGGDGVGVSPDLSLYFGNADGTLGSETHLSVGAENVYPYGWTFPLGIASGDVDGDGLRDIVVAMNGLPAPGIAGAVRILRGLGGRAFGSPITVADTVSSAAVTVSDLDADGDSDIVVADAALYVSINPGGLYVLRNDGSGNFTPSGLLSAGIGPIEVQVADLTLDGVSDLVVFNNAGYMAVLPGLGGAAYGDPLNFGLFGFPLAMVKGDFDSDGRPDMLVVSQSGVFVLRNQAIPPLQIDASISFSSPLGHGSGILTWTTSAEWDLAGFNIIEETPRGPRRINGVLIPCEECLTGRGQTYVAYVPKHRGGRSLFVQAVHRDGTVENFGPVRRE